MKLRFQNFISFYFLLFIVFFPVNIDSFDFQKSVSLFLFEDLTRFLGSLFLAKAFLIDFSSDSFSMLMLLFIFLILSVIFSFLLNKSRRIFSFTQKVTVYYIAVVLLKYGVDKLFKTQFYLPEPNILYTKFGNLDQDILYWSVMGTSRSYSILLGIIEIGITLLLLFKKTRFVGLILAFFTFTNIIIINFCFDISVKFFSTTLLLMTIFAIGNTWKAIYIFLIKKRMISVETSDFAFEKKFLPFLFPAKILGLGFVLLQTFLPYFHNKNWNDDLAKRPFLHGSYEVINNSKKNIKYVFFHRDNYLIFMDKQEHTWDYHYEIDTAKQKVSARNNFENTLIFEYKFENNLLLFKNEHQEILKLKKIDWKNMPALQPKFHWFTEQL